MGRRKVSSILLKKKEIMILDLGIGMMALG
jgi:hypothetical protein